MTNADKIRSMTNRQWLIWQLIDMSEDDLATRLSVEWFCDYHCPNDQNIACNERCRDNIVEWLQQEHVESNAIKRVELKS